MTVKTAERDTVTMRKRRQQASAGDSVYREQVLDSLLEELRLRAECADTSVLQEMLSLLAPSEQPEPRDPAVSTMVDALSHGRHYSTEETVLMELELQRRAFEMRRRLLRGALTTAQVAQLLGTKRQTPHDRVKSGTLLGIEENGRWLFPYWQFDATGPNGVVDGLPETVRALRGSAVARANWLTLSNPYLEGRSPLQALKAGEIERVVDIAQAVGAN